MSDLKIKDVVIGIDNGYGNTKSENTIIKSGVSVSDREPIVSKDYYKLDNKYIVFGESGMEFTSDKTGSEEHYYLTIASLVKELEHRGSSKVSVILAVGLPLTWCGSDDKVRFRDYIMRKPVIDLVYKDKPYHIEILETYVFPQGFAAVIGRYNMTGRNMIVDIGSGTVDSMQINDMRPIEKSTNTEKIGVGSCKEKIRRDISTILHTDYEEDIIDDYLINGCDGSESDLTRIIAENARDYCRTLISKIENNGFKVGLTTLYVIGGGARIMRNFSDIGTVPGVNIIDDIHANAKGYANLAMQVMKRNKEK